MVDVGNFPLKYIRKYKIVQEDLSRAVSRVLYAIKSILSRKLSSPAMGQGIYSRNRVWN